MTCFKGHSSSLYKAAITAFFFSHTSDEIGIDPFIIGEANNGESSRSKLIQLYELEECDKTMQKQGRKDAS